MIISVTEYKEKFCNTKIIKTDDDIEFEIRRISLLDLWEDGEIKKDNPHDFTKRVIIKGVVNPKISSNGKEGLAIRDLSVKHYQKLTAEILEYSGYTKGGKPTDFLSQEPKV